MGILNSELDRERKKNASLEDKNLELRELLGACLPYLKRAEVSLGELFDTTDETSHFDEHIEILRLIKAVNKEQLNDQDQ